MTGRNCQKKGLIPTSVQGTQPPAYRATYTMPAYTYYAYIYHNYKLDWAAEHPLTPIPWCGIWKFSTLDTNSHPEMRKGLRHWSFIGCTLQYSCKSLANHWKCWLISCCQICHRCILLAIALSFWDLFPAWLSLWGREPLIHRRYPCCWDQGGLNLHYGIERTWKMVKWRLCPPALMPLLPCILCSSCSSDPLRRLIAQHLVDLGSANALALLRYQVTNWRVISAKRGVTTVLSRQLGTISGKKKIIRPILDPHQGHTTTLGFEWSCRWTPCCCGAMQKCTSELYSFVNFFIHQSYTPSDCKLPNCTTTWHVNFGITL